MLLFFLDILIHNAVLRFYYIIYCEYSVVHTEMMCYLPDLRATAKIEID